MSFALTKVKVSGIEVEEAVNKRYSQIMQLDITAADTDTDLDLGDYSGTFWTAVGGTEPGATALKAIKDVQTRADTFISVSIPGQRQDGTAAAGVYTVAMDATNDNLPNITFNSGDAPEAYHVLVQWLLKDQEQPVEVTEAA